MKLRIATAVVASISMLAGIPALAQDGATLFKTKCAMCHGDQGQGKPPMAPKIAGSAKGRRRPHQGRRGQGPAHQADEHGHRRPGSRAGRLRQGPEVESAGLHPRENFEGGREPVPVSAPSVTAAALCLAACVRRRRRRNQRDLRRRGRRRRQRLHIALMHGDIAVGGRNVNQRAAGADGSAQRLAFSRALVPRVESRCRYRRWWCGLHVKPAFSGSVAWMEPLRSSSVMLPSVGAAVRSIVPLRVGDRDVAGHAIQRDVAVAAWSAPPGPSPGRRRCSDALISASPSRRANCKSVRLVWKRIGAVDVLQMRGAEDIAG